MTEKRTAKAVVSADKTTLTFYYDDVDHSEGITFNLNKVNDCPEWSVCKRTISTVVFDASFRDARPTTTNDWFFAFKKLKAIKGIENLNTSEVWNMSWMFGGCDSLTSLDLSSFNTENVVDMRWMFGFCEALESLDISNFCIKNPSIADCMFEGCDSLKTIKTHIEQKDTDETLTI